MEDQQGTVRGTGEVAGAETAAADKKERALRTRCKKYGISVEYYNAIGEKQGWRCGICGRHQSEFTISLNIDHMHFKVVATPFNNQPGWAPKMWHAIASFRGQILAEAIEVTKSGAVASARRLALPKSVRGLLCPGRYTGCNRLMGRIDDIPWLENTLAYLKNTPASQIENLNEKAWKYQNSVDTRPAL
jgi:hypothetical protein